MAISGYRSKVSLRNYIGRRCNFVAWGSGCSLLMNWGGELTYSRNKTQWMGYNGIRYNKTWRQGWKILERYILRKAVIVCFNLICLNLRWISCLVVSEISIEWKISTSFPGSSLFLLRRERTRGTSLKKCIKIAKLCSLISFWSWRIIDSFLRIGSR